MRDFNEVKTTLKLELDHWFSRQCNENTKYYLYYQESTAEHTSGLLICANKPSEQFKLVSDEPVNGFRTVQQNFYKFIDMLAKLPILD